MGFPVRHEDSSLSDTDNISLLAIEALTFLRNNQKKGQYSTLNTQYKLQPVTERDPFSRSTLYLCNIVLTNHIIEFNYDYEHGM